MHGNRDWYKRVTTPPGLNRRLSENRIVERVVHVVIDGLSQSFLLTSLPPNLRQLMERGTWVESCHTIWPSVTGPAHTAINTGTYPGVNRVVLPYISHPGTKEVSIVNPLAESRAESIAEALGRQGYTTAGICGHMNRGLHYFVSEAIVGHDAERVTDEAITALNKCHPEYLQVVYFAVDTVQHLFGVSTEAAHEALQWVDGELGRLLAAVSTDRQRTAVIVSADHGQVACAENVTELVAPFLESMGIRWHGYGRFALLFCDNQSAQLDGLQNLIQSHCALSTFIHSLWTKDDLALVGAVASEYGDGVLLLKPGYGMYSTAGNEYLANHGGYSRDEVVVPLIFSGPGIASGRQLPFAEVIDIAPTITHLLGCRPPTESSGQVLSILDCPGLSENNNTSYRQRLLRKLLG